MRATAFICGVLLSLCLPAFALAAPIPPGNSAVDQYSESYPSAGGGETSNPSGSNPASPDKSLGHQTAQEFAGAGPDGQSAADLAAATAPKGNSPSSAATGAGETSGGGSGDSGPLQVASHAVGDSDSGGMGVLLPLILAATVLGFGALLAVRIRRVRTG